jgi:tagaturonate reductase
VISNTTEVGLIRDPRDAFDGSPPQSFPAKLTRWLYERAITAEFDTARGVVVLPCELIEDNGSTLSRLVLETAAAWSLDHRFATWFADAVIVCNTLVDRIVPGAPSRADAERFERLHGYRDGMLTTCESYALFAIEGNDALRARLEFPGNDPRVVVAPDIRPYRERKIRLLNGGHTIAVPVGLLAGLTTVREAVRDPQVGAFVRRAMVDEIAPCLDVPRADDFAREVLERFDNPHIRHALVDISLHGTTKMRVRIVPSILAYADQTGRAPAALTFGFAAFLAFMRGEIHAERLAAGLSMPTDTHGERLRAAWRESSPRSDDDVRAFARSLCSDVDLWGADLAAIPGFADRLTDDLARICRSGVRSALDTQSTELATR